MKKLQVLVLLILSLHYTLQASRKSEPIIELQQLDASEIKNCLYDEMGVIWRTDILQKFKNNRREAQRDIRKNCTHTASENDHPVYAFLRNKCYDQETSSKIEESLHLVHDASLKKYKRELRNLLIKNATKEELMTHRNKFIIDV